MEGKFSRPNFNHYSRIFIEKPENHGEPEAL
jgi:hypothetical protein